MNSVTQYAIPIAMWLSQIKESSANDSENVGLVLRRNKIFIPAKLSQKVLTIAHQGHLGITETESLMREKVSWQGMDKEVENFIN